jgi:hypothetical protein
MLAEENSAVWFLTPIWDTNLENVMTSPGQGSIGGR